MYKVKLLFLFLTLSFISSGQSLLIKDKQGHIVEQIFIADRIHLEFRDSIRFAEKDKILVLPLIVKSTAPVIAIKDSVIILDSPWMKAYTEGNKNIINVSAYSDMETDYRIIGISNKINLKDIIVLRKKRKSYDQGSYIFLIE